MSRLQREGSPRVGASNPAIRRRSVVLPQPDGPSSVKNSLAFAGCEDAFAKRIERRGQRAIRGLRPCIDRSGVAALEMLAGESGYHIQLHSKRLHGPDTESRFLAKAAEREEDRGLALRYQDRPFRP
jgi:hypothetical protein